LECCEFSSVYLYYSNGIKSTGREKNECIASMEGLKGGRVDT